MAHEKRSHYFDYLKRKLGDVPFSIDTDKLQLGTWGNRKQAMLMANKDSDYTCIIQDDAVIPDNFYEYLERFIRQHPNQFYQLYFGTRRNTMSIPAKQGADIRRFIKERMRWGVAIVTPTKLTNSIIDYCDKLPSDMPDDTRIKHYMVAKGKDAYYPYPSLVDHRHGESLVNDSGYRVAQSYIDRIPKVIHQIWVGDKIPPHSMIRTWKNVKDFEHKLWSEKQLNRLNMKNRRLFDYFMAKKLYHGASDVARLEILEQYGGVYIDIDTERLREFRAHFLDGSFFAVEANPKPKMPYRIANGVIGAKPYHPIITEYIKRMGEADKVEPCWSTIGGTLFTQVINDYPSDDPAVHILKPHWFYPKSSWGYVNPRADQAIAIHHWGSKNKELYAVK